MMQKFRAYLKDTKKIVDVATIFFDNGVIKTENNDFYQFEDIILMQSTGLHDNTKFEDLSEKEQVEWLESGKSADEWKGREVFEGDIVKILYDSEPFTGVVVYDLGETDFKATNNHDDCGNNFQYLTVGESIKTIGNVHQHPKLLEDV